MPVPIRRSLHVLIAALLLGTACAEAVGPDVTITRVTLAPTGTTINVGSTHQLNATARNRAGDSIPNIDFTFQSLQPTIAIVSSSGLVTGVDRGSATIIATSGTFTASAIVTVATPACTNAAVTNTVSFPQTINGALQTSDCLFDALGNGDGYRFVVTTPSAVIFTLTGATIRPKLTLTGALVTDILDQEWSFTLGDTANLFANLPAGTYTLWVVNDGADFGPYVLTSRSAVACSPAIATATIAVGETVNGALTASSCILPNSAEGMAWSFNLTEPADVRFDVGANGFEPWMVVTDNLFIGYAISFPVGADSAVLQGFLQAGNYNIWVTTLEGGQGTFTLSRSTPAPVSVCTTVVDTISVPGSIAGSLTPDDCVVEPGFASDPILMEVLTSTTLRIDLMSFDLDTYLAIANAAGTIILENDDGGDDTNSQIIATFPVGQYTIYPRSFWSNEYGDYTLSVSIGAGISGDINEGNVRITTKPRARIRDFMTLRR